MGQVVLIGVVIITLGLISSCIGQRIPPPPQSFLNNLNIQQGGGQNGSVASLQSKQQQQQEELASINIKDENIKRVLLELSTLQTPSQLAETMARVSELVGPLFIADYDKRKSELAQGKDLAFPQRLLSAVTDIQGEETKALVLQKQLSLLHAGDFAFLPLAIQYGLQSDILRNLSGTKLATVIKSNPGDTVVAFKILESLTDRQDDQLEFLQSLGPKLLPDVQTIIVNQLLKWWPDPHTWKDRQLSLLISSGSPLLAFMPQSQLQSFDDELADRFVTILGQTQDIGRNWWKKPMGMKKAWFDLAKGARYFGAVHEWSFRRMQKLSFLLEGASPEDLELIPPVPEIKGLVIGNHYTELQARVVFDVFYNTPPLSQEDLQEFQFHVLDLTPNQLQRFDFADSFGTLDEMMSVLERQPLPSYPTILQISYFMWPILNSTNSNVMNIAPPAIWQQRELSQIGKMFFLLPKSLLNQIKPDAMKWDSNILTAIRSSHLSTFQIWRLTSQMLLTVDERFKPDYIFMIPSPFQRGIPTQNISQALLGTTNIRPEILRSLLEETSGMLTSQKAVILQRISHRMTEAIIIRTLISTPKPADIFSLISPKVLAKNMGTITKTILEMPETGKFGLTSMQAKLLPKTVLSIWLRWVRETVQVARWTAEDLLGRSQLGATNELNLAILGLNCQEVSLVDPWDITSVIMHYRHELYSLRRFSPSLKFNINLRSCVLSKFAEYLKQKMVLNNDQSNENIFSATTLGEITAVGGEVLSIVPKSIWGELDTETRTNIIKEIGNVQMLELFRLATLDDIRWYAKTLYENIGDTSSEGAPTLRRRRETTEAAPEPSSGEVAANSTNTTTSQSDSNKEPTNFDVSAIPIPGIDTRSSDNTPPKKREINLDALNNMGNFICYAENMLDDPEWKRSILKDVLESKTSIGEKTCCLSKALREKWFKSLQQAYGTDPSSWNEFDLAAIGDLLVVIPEADLQKISVDSLAKAVTPIMRQSAFSEKIFTPGPQRVKGVQFVTICSEALGTEGADFLAAYKSLMKRFFQASQWMVNSVKTTQELVREGVGRTGRIPRWAEHTLVKRQIPLSLGSGELSFSGLASPATATGGVVQTVPTQQVISNVPVQSYVSYSPVMASPTQFTMAGHPQFSPMYAQPQFMSQPIITTASQPQMFPSNQFTYTYGQPTFVTNPMQIQSTPTVGFTPQTVMVNPVQPQMGVVGAGMVIQDGSLAQQGIVGGSFAPASTGVAGGSFTPVGTAVSGGSFAPAVAGGSFAPAGAGTSQVAGGGSFAAAGAATVQVGSGGGSFAQAGAGSTQQQQQQQGGSFSQGTGSDQAGSFTPRQVGAHDQPPPQQSSSTMPIQQQPGPNDAANPPHQQQATGAVPPALPSQTQGSSPPPLNQPPPQTQGVSVPPPNQPPQNSASSLPVPPPQPPSGGGVPVSNPSLQQQQPGTGSTSQQQQPVPVPVPLPPQAGSNVQNALPQQPSAPIQPPQTQPSQAFNPGANILTASAPGFQGRSGGGVLDDKQVRSLNFASFQDDSHNAEISCNGIKAAGQAAIGLTIDDLNKLPEVELFDCVEPIGRIEWEDDTKARILTLLKQKLSFNKDSITAITLIEMGDLVTAFTANAPDGGSDGFNSAAANDTVHSDVSMIDLTLPSSLDVLSILGQKIVNPDLLKSLAEKFNQDNGIFPGFSEGIARPENLRIVVISLGNVICGLNDKIVNSMFESDASLFVDTSSVLGKLEGCSIDVLKTLASHAVRPSNYGPPRLWTPEDVTTIGVVVAGMKPEAIAEISDDAIAGLTPLAVKSLPVTTLVNLDAKQIKKLSFVAAMALSSAQLNALSSEQSEAIRSIIQVQPDLFHVDVKQNFTARDAESDTDLHGRARGGDSKDSPTTPAPAGGQSEPTSTTTEQTTTTPPPTLAEAPISAATTNHQSLPSTNFYLSAIVALLPVISFFRM